MCDQRDTVSSESVAINLLDAAYTPGARLEGVVSGLPKQHGPLEVQYKCEESCKRVLVSDHRYMTALAAFPKPLRTRTVASVTAQLADVGDGHAVFAFELPADLPPNFIGLHDSNHHTLVYTAHHSVSVMHSGGRSLAKAWVNVVPAPGTEAKQDAPHRFTSRNMRVLPRISIRYRILCTVIPLRADWL